MKIVICAKPPSYLISYVLLTKMITCCNGKWTEKAVNRSIRCFCPSDNFTPRSPTAVRYPSAGSCAHDGPRAGRALGDVQVQFDGEVVRGSSSGVGGVAAPPFAGRRRRRGWRWVGVYLTATLFFSCWLSPMQRQVRRERVGAAGSVRLASVQIKQQKNQKAK